MKRKRSFLMYAISIVLFTLVVMFAKWFIEIKAVSSFAECEKAVGSFTALSLPATCTTLDGRIFRQQIHN